MIVRCAGRITIESRDLLRHAVAAEPRVKSVVLDLAEVTAIDAAGVGALVSLRRRANFTGTRLKLMNITPKVDEVLEITKVKSAFEFCSLREMIDLFCRAHAVSQTQAEHAMVG